MWVLSVYVNGTWMKENWRYNNQHIAMEWARQYVEQHNAEAAVVEQVAEQKASLIQTWDWGCGWDPKWDWMQPEDPWNFKRSDYFKGVRIRERHRKKHRQE